MNLCIHECNHPHVVMTVNKYHNCFAHHDHMYRAVQASQWQDAITSYSEAINACADAPPVFSAVLHSNRAAAYQGLQQYADAVADNLRAKALDPSYGKVWSRLICVCVIGTSPLPDGNLPLPQKFCLLRCLTRSFESVLNRGWEHKEFAANRGQNQGEKALPESLS